MSAYLDILFGKPPTTKAAIRDSQRDMTRDIRTLTRQRKKMEQKERLAKLDAKAEAEKGNVASAKSKARLASRTRLMINRFNELEVDLECVSGQLGMMGAVTAMQQSMRNAVKAMWKMNTQVSLPMMQQIMRQFEMEKDKMDFKEELMSNTLEDALGSEEAQAEEDAIYNQIMDEIGLKQSEAMSNTPARAPPKTVSLTPADGSLDEEFTARLNNLRRDDD